MKRLLAELRRARRPKRPGRSRRGVALVMVLGALTLLTVMLTELQGESSAELGSALSERDGLKAEYAARSAVNLSRLLIAAEPTIRAAIAPLFLLQRQGPPQIPVWEFADQVLGAFNDAAGSERFTALSSVNLAEGRNLGLEGAGFEVTVVDEDSKINFNLPARGDAFSQARLAAQVMGLIGGLQYTPMFERRDADGSFSDRQAVCSAIIDWTDPDQDEYRCDTDSATAQQAAAEDSFYQLLDSPYQRKNAAMDSLEELHLVRGISDDFWATFIDPDPENPHKRNATVWGQGAINVNTANAQTILSVVVSAATPEAKIRTDPAEQATFLSALTLVRGFTAGAPLFGTPNAFLAALKHQGVFGPVLKALGLEPVPLLSESELAKAITTESKVFSVYATGYVRAGQRSTETRVHAVVDFRGAPGVSELMESAGLGPAGQNPEGSQGATGDEGELEGEAAIAGAVKADPAGNVVYYRVE
jgi:general secretion pathway protein K